MYTEYLEHYKTQSAKFGPKVAIFLMVGIFYEMYDERGPNKEPATSFQELIDLLGIKVSVKKGEGPSGPEYDGLVAGIPDYTVHKWAARLTQLGWAVVLVEQVKNPVGKVIKRQVQRILTPGSHVEAAGSNDLFLTFISISANLSDSVHLAITAVDLTTGHLHVFETRAKGTLDAWTSDYMVHFMELYPPREVLWSIEGPKHFCESLTEIKLKSIVACRSSTMFHQRQPLNSGAWLSSIFREEYLRSRCSLKSLLPTHSALQVVPGSLIETTLLSLLYALEELWPSMSLGPLLVYPWTPESFMKLGENALVQLHMIVQGGDSQSKQDVLSLFNKCSTAMGRRGIRERLLKPSACPNVIRGLLDSVEAWVSKSKETRGATQRKMRTITDLDRLYRKIQQGTITAMDLVVLDTSFKALECLTEFSDQDKGHVVNCRAEVFKVFDVVKAYEASDDKTLFNSGLVPHLDALEAQIQTQQSHISKWIEDVAKAARVTVDTFKPEFRERSLVIKAPRAVIQTLKMANALPPNTTATTSKTTSYLESDDLERINIMIMRLRECLQRQQSVALVEAGTELADGLFDTWHKVTEWITQADVNLTLAHVADELGYNRPRIIDTDSSGSSVHIEGLRHPLLEAQDRKIPYVQHNVGIGSSDSKQGWLLYGLNASGKSSLMRATGLAVLLAQAGSFVPATNMTLAPFQSLHTRIINTDNLWMGLSSFAVEMSEMRDIFREAGPRSLVLGDELCSGTETTSATALVAAGIKGLLGRGAKFLFATHLHGLTQIQEVYKDSRLKVWHLHVEYDRVKDKLVYHRNLKEGSGSSLYGLEVAKAMRIPADILEDAVRFRKQLAGESEFSEVVGSSWNSNVFRIKCSKCGIMETSELEVHHIRERATADSRGRLVDGSSVHSQANLAVLCDKCHDEHHRHALDVMPLIQTSDGPEESVASGSAEPSPLSSDSRKSKWSQEELVTITTVCAQFRNLSNQNLSKYLLNHHRIEISSGTLKKFRD